MNGLDNTPLHATVTPTASIKNWIPITGDTHPLALWLEVQAGNGLTPTADDPVAAFLAKEGIMAPSANPSYDANFSFIGASVSMTATFTPRAAVLTLADLLIQILNATRGLSVPTVSQTIGFGEDIQSITPIGEAVDAFTKSKPMNPVQYSQAAAKAFIALTTLATKDAASRKKLSDAIERHFGLSLGEDGIDQVLTRLTNGSKLFISFYDIIAFNAMTQGNPLQISFVATVQ